MYFCDVQIQGTIETDGDDMTEEFRRELNFRELAGYIAQDGRKIRSGMLYRSAALGLLNREERDLFRRLGIRTILDFRSRRAVRELPDPVFENCEQIAMCAAFENFREDLNDSPREFYQMLVDEDQQGNIIAAVVSSIHASLVYSNEAYRLMFRKLLNSEAPLLIHCSQGKDRTGIGALLIMLAEKRISSMRLLHKLSDNVRTAILAVEGVLPEAVHMILAEIRERYGTYENFLLHEYALQKEDLEKLRNLYLI